MDYVWDICSLAAEIEKNIKKSVDYDELETLVGYSYHHIRDFFKQNTNTTLSRYILARRIANAAFEIRYSDKSITEIAYEYEFSNPDTFTRAFRRYTGVTPSLFKKSNCLCGRRIIAPGVYAPVILDLDNSTFTLQYFREVNEMGELKKTVDSCILYGVPDIRETTKNGIKMDLPFPNCLQVVLNYMGQDISYTHIMAATGLAFSQRWCIDAWNEAAIDSRTLYETPFKPFELAFKGAGRKYEISVSDEQKNCKAITKEDALKLIKAELDCGRPLIALGVVGPPEPCLITGYRNNGETVLGWSLFQNDNWLRDAGFPTPNGVDESGYFIKDNWWNGTQAVMSIGEEVNTPTFEKDILQNALNIMTKEKTGSYYGNEFYYNGQAAYEAWANTVVNDEKWFGNDGGGYAWMCHTDQSRMLASRAMAATYVESLTERYTNISKEIKSCASYLKKAAACAESMQQACLRSKEIIQHKETRFVVALHIRKAAEYEGKAVEILQDILEKMSAL